MSGLSGGFVGFSGFAFGSSEETTLGDGEDSVPSGFGNGPGFLADIAGFGSTIGFGLQREMMLEILNITRNLTERSKECNNIFVIYCSNLASSSVSVARPANGHKHTEIAFHGIGVDREALQLHAHTVVERI